MPPMDPESGGRWGLMGGVFDPVHYGHLILADCAVQSYSLSGVLFTVSFSPPHRDRKPEASFKDRIEMVKLAAEGNERFVVSDLEKDLDSPGYTVNIVNHLKRQYPGADWHLILGADNIAVFESWYKPEELSRNVKIVVGNRPGFNSEFEHSEWYDRVDKFEMPLIDISSTMIRQSIGEGRSIRYLLPDNVRRFIIEKGLYL